MNYIGKIPPIDDDRLEIKREARANLVKQVAAISAFEGLHPSQEYAELRDRFVVGEITAEEMKASLLKKWRKNG